MYKIHTASAFEHRPCIVLADDSRIVRATLIKHIQGTFRFREAVDGEEAWEMLLVDPTIRIMITDLTMPRLDGYGLLKRIRASAIPRIRNLPVIVISGNDDPEERIRAKAAGATELITKSIATTQLLSRLEVLTTLSSAARQYESQATSALDPLEDSQSRIISSRHRMLQAIRIATETAQQSGALAVFSVCLRFHDSAGVPRDMMDALAQALQASVRQGDSVAPMDVAELVVASPGNGGDIARGIGNRLCRVVMKSGLIAKGQAVAAVACGMVTLDEYVAKGEGVVPSPDALWRTAQRRCQLALQHGRSGLVGNAEERALLRT